MSNRRLAVNKKAKNSRSSFSHSNAKIKPSKGFGESTPKKSFREKLWEASEEFVTDRQAYEIAKLCNFDLDEVIGFALSTSPEYFDEIDADLGIQKRIEGSCKILLERAFGYQMRKGGL